MIGKVGHPAGFFIRFIGFYIDIFLFWAVFFTFLYFSGLGTGSLPEVVGISIVSLSIFGFLGGFIYSFYLASTTSKFGATIGKMLVGVTVKNELGNKLTLKQGLFRYIIGYMVASLLFGLGFLWIIRDPKKQGWHDMVTGSYVVKTSENRWLLGILSLLFLFAFNIFMVVGIVQSVIENNNLKSDIDKIVNKAKEKKNVDNINDFQDQNIQIENNINLYQYNNSPNPTEIIWR